MNYTIQIWKNGTQVIYFDDGEIFINRSGEHWNTEEIEEYKKLPNFPPLQKKA